MPEDTIEPFGFPAVGRKKLIAAFDGGRLTSDGGVMLLAAAERRLGIATTLAPLITDPRDPARVTHSVDDILRARMLAIACGYEDADDLDHLRRDPAFKLACGRLPDSGADLCSQPTMSRWENAPTLREVIRMTYAMVDIYCASYAKPPVAVTFDIDDTVDIVHGHQQLALFNAHYDERCFQPIHVYDTATSRPVAVVLRPGKTPSGPEIRNHLRRLVRRIRRHWPTTRLTIRGDGHYARHEVMAWCAANGVDYILGLPGNAVLDRLVEVAADDVRVRRAEGEAPVVRRYSETRYGAKSWRCLRRVAARIEATSQGLDIRYVVTSLTRGTAEWLYDSLYCARGQAENLIKLMWTAPPRQSAFAHPLLKSTPPCSTPRGERVASSVFGAPLVPTMSERYVAQGRSRPPRAFLRGRSAATRRLAASCGQSSMASTHVLTALSTVAPPDKF
jgi:Transposase DDE domain group 1